MHSDSQYSKRDIDRVLMALMSIPILVVIFGFGTFMITVESSNNIKALRKQVAELEQVQQQIQQQPDNLTQCVQRERTSWFGAVRQAEVDCSAGVQ